MKYYCSYADYLLCYDSDEAAVSVSCGETVIDRAKILGLFHEGALVYPIEAYTVASVARPIGEKSYGMNITLRTEKADYPPTVSLNFAADDNGITFSTFNGKRYALNLEGHIRFGTEGKTFAIRTGESDSILRAAIGPAAGEQDNAVYDRLNDTAFCVTGCLDFRLAYDFARRCYGFTLSTADRGYTETVRFSVKKGVLTEQFPVRFAPMRTYAGSTRPRSGWMTWYAVQFNACEEVVLRNVDFQRKYLKPYGADTVWVDWEWTHKDYDSRRNDGVDVFHPDPQKYPHGLKYVADRIREAGFAPALWFGFTTDLSLNEYAAEHPEIILCEDESWCGAYFYDFTHPKYLNEFLPKALGNVKAWGYDIIKYDTVTTAWDKHQSHHEKMYDPMVTDHEAFRGMIRKTREVLGDEVYMLACAARTDPNMVCFADVFNGARVGGDVFSWSDFIKNCVDRIRRYYPMHNVVLHTDPDNLILREQFNTADQAISRLSFISLLGLPLTFGDDLTELPPERVELIRRALPVPEMHPMTFEPSLTDGTVQIIDLSVCLPFEAYHVVDAFNMTDAPAEKRMDFVQTLHFPQGEYHVFDYFANTYLGIYSRDIPVSLRPYESKVYAVRKVQPHPQIISTSRHITQGATELKDVSWAENTLTLTAELVAGDAYTVTVSVPEGYRFAEANLGTVTEAEGYLQLTFTPKQSGNCTFALTFTQK